MESEGVSLPLIHDHLLIPYNDLQRGSCCGGFEAISDGYYCKRCRFFFHKKCCESSEYIQHPSHSAHTLRLTKITSNHTCDLCEKRFSNLCYGCKICNYSIDLHCVKNPPPEVIDISETHRHKLILLKEVTKFDCAANCGKDGSGFSYECHECDLAFHIECVWCLPKVNYMLEVNHSYHSFHPLKLLMGKPPKYSDGKCRLCRNNIDILFYHCSSCNFTLDLRCVLNPPSRLLLDLKTHDHQLTLLPRLDIFTCNACGSKADRSPYACSHCGFMIHQYCVGLPRIININRHDHRISRTYNLGVMNSICGVCRKKVNWTLGGYSCQKCPNYVVHSICATKKMVWNGKELEGVPEEIEDIEPYVVIDDNTIQHFSHKEHHLRLNANGLLCDNNKRCRACIHPVCLQSFYGCMNCDFILHQSCAEFPRRKWHVLHNERLTLVTSVDGWFQCDACYGISNGFKYEHGDKEIDVRCGSISEPFVHPSHHHPLYYIPERGYTICNGCKERKTCVLKCIEDGCEFFLDFGCATLPQLVKHRVDDHLLSLCYGEKASGKYWCDICEKETNPKIWFYTSKDHRASLHRECVLGDFIGLMPGKPIRIPGILHEAVFNSSMSRPFCRKCKSRCIKPIILKTYGISDAYNCSFTCLFNS